MRLYFLFLAGFVVTFPRMTAESMSVSDSHRRRHKISVVDNSPYPHRFRDYEGTTASCHNMLWARSADRRLRKLTMLQNKMQHEVNPDKTQCSTYGVLGRSHTELYES